MNTPTIDTVTTPSSGGASARPAGAVLAENEQFLRDTFGSALRDGSCVLDADGRVGYVRLEFGTRRGPDSLYWDGWFSVAPTRDAHPLRGKLLRGGMVQLIGRAS